MATITRTQPPASGLREPTTWESFKSGLRASGVPWLFIVPSLIVMMFITFTPQAYQIVISLQDFRVQNLAADAPPAEFIGLQNFREVISGLNVPNYAFFPLLGFNIMWTVVNVAFHAGMGLAVALALNARYVLGRRIYRVLFVLPWALPGYISALIWNNLWQQRDGGFNLVLQAFNDNFGTAFTENINWLSDLNRPLDLRPIMPLLIIVGCTLLALWLIRRTFKLGLARPEGGIYAERAVFSIGGIIVLFAAAIGTLLDALGGGVYTYNLVVQSFDRAAAPTLAFYAVLLANIWLGWPFMMVVATGALQSIPPDLYEAADVDGASRWTQFTQITLPLLRSAMVPAIMLGTVWTFNQFNVIFFITGGGPRGQTDLLVTQAYKLIAQEQLYGAAAAFSIIVFFVLLVITLINNRVTRATKSYDEA